MVERQSPRRPNLNRINSRQMSYGWEGRFIRPSNSLVVFKALCDQVRHAADNRLGCEFTLAESFLKEAL